MEPMLGSLVVNLYVLKCQSMQCANNQYLLAVIQLTGGVNWFILHFAKYWIFPLVLCNIWLCTVKPGYLSRFYCIWIDMFFSAAGYRVGEIDVTFFCTVFIPCNIWPVFKPLNWILVIVKKVNINLCLWSHWYGK